MGAWGKVLFSGVDKGLYQGLQLWKVVCHDFPNDLKVTVEGFVGNAITHSN